MFGGYKVGDKICEVNILQYVDDTIFFGEVSGRNIFAIKTMLRIFELVMHKNSTKKSVSYIIVKMD